MKAKSFFSSLIIISFGILQTIIICAWVVGLIWFELFALWGRGYSWWQMLLILCFKLLVLVFGFLFILPWFKLICKKETWRVS